MALNFPNSPTNGQLYTDSASGNRWVWDSGNTCWVSTSTFTQTITVASTAPGSPVAGQLWWNKDYGRLLVYYTDDNTSQWVDASPSDATGQLAYGQSNTVFGVANAAFGVANTALQNTNVTLAGNLTVTGNVVANKQVIVTYTPATSVNAAITLAGANTQGGIGYVDFLKATNLSGGATNPNKTFRLNSTGGIEIINSAYSAVLMSLDENANLGLNTGSPQTNLHVYGSSKSGMRMVGGTSNSDLFQRHLCQIDNIYTWTTLLSITPSTVGATWMRGFVKCSISCHNSGNGNGALIDAIWYLDLNGGSGATTAQVSAGTTSGSWPGQFRVNMSGNIWQLQVQSTNTANRFDGVAMFDILLSHGAGTAATFTIA